MSNADARRRAQRLIDAGDRHLRHALVERPKLATALSSYRRAAAIAPDLPDPLIRQAIVLVALDRQADASQALATVTAIDPRLGDSVGARGAAVVHEICQGTPSEEGPGLNWIAERWSERWHPEMARLAGGAAAAGR